MRTDMWLYDETGEPLVDLSILEPFCNSVGGMPVTRIEYRHHSVTIEWATQEQMEAMKEWFSD